MTSLAKGIGSLCGAKELGTKAGMAVGVAAALATVALPILFVMRPGGIYLPR